jgi:hypothetical protein
VQRLAERRAQRARGVRLKARDKPVASLSLTGELGEQNSLPYTAQAVENCRLSTAAALDASHANTPRLDLFVPARQRARIPACPRGIGIRHGVHI